MEIRFLLKRRNSTKIHAVFISEYQELTIHHRKKVESLPAPVAYRGGEGFGCSNSSPPEIPKALQNRATLNPICENC